MAKKEAAVKVEEPTYKSYTLRDMYDVIERRKSRAELREMYKELFGKETAGTNGDWLREKIAYELQRRLKYPTGEPESVRSKRESLGEDEPVKALREKLAKRKERDLRLPSVGKIIERKYGDRLIRLRVGEYDFELLDEDGGVRGTYKSLSGAARAVCACEVNGFVFFGLDSKRKEPTV